ncbi:glycosyl transferase family 1, partial [Pseudomonas sp. F1_0610]
MKILIIITGLGMGGAEHQVCDLADFFSSLGHSVSIVSLTGEAIVKPKNESVVVYSLYMEKTFIGFLKAYFKTKK